MAGVGFFFSGTLYPNNSVLSIATNDVEGQENFKSWLYCLTNAVTCCRGASDALYNNGRDPAVTGGEWFLPGNDKPVVDYDSTDAGQVDFVVSRFSGAVLLSRSSSNSNSNSHSNSNSNGNDISSSSGVPAGIYTCVIPGEAGPDQLRTAYIGVNTGIALICYNVL